MVYHANHAGTGAGYQGGDHGAVDYSMLDPDKEDENRANYDSNKDYQNKDDDKFGGGYQSNKDDDENKKKDEEAKGLDKRVEDNESKKKEENAEEASDEH